MIIVTWNFRVGHIVGRYLIEDLGFLTMSESCTNSQCTRALLTQE